MISSGGWTACKSYLTPKRYGFRDADGNQVVYNLYSNGKCEASKGALILKSNCTYADIKAYHYNITYSTITLQGTTYRVYQNGKVVYTNGTVLIENGGETALINYIQQ